MDAFDPIADPHQAKYASPMTRADTGFGDLIPELGEWNGGSGIAPEDWIRCIGTFELAIGYSLIFWPRFVVIDDCVLRYGATKQNLDSWLEATNGDLLATESVMNHMHISDLHNKEVSEAQARYLGRALREIYQTKLSLEFPDRSFVVRLSDEPNLDLLDYELTFWQLRPAKAG